MTSESQIIVPVLKVLKDAEGGSLSTGEVRRRVKATLRLTQSDLFPLKNRPDYRIDQTIRNLKSHRNVPGNPFHDGYLRDVPRGYAITSLGLAYLATG
jgi:hypothetical protein